MFEDIRYFFESKLDYLVLEVNDYELHLYNIVIALVWVATIWGLTKLCTRLFLPYLRTKGIIDLDSKKKVKRIIYSIAYAIMLIAVLRSLHLDFVLYDSEDRGIGPLDEDDSGFFSNISLRISLLIQAFIIFKVAQLLDWIVGRVLMQQYYDKREQWTEKLQKKEEDTKPDTTKKSANRIIQYVVYLLAIIFLIKSFGLDYTLINPKKINGYEFTISSIFSALFVIFLARLFVWIIVNIVLYTYYRRSRVNMGSQFAINQIVTYVVYVLAIVYALEVFLGVNVNLLLGGAAALLVGIGLGLQETFNDLISGLILLFERSVEVGDTVEVDNLVGTVESIGIRTSVVRTRQNVAIIVPNHKFITEKVINWAHHDDRVRFIINVGTAYGSDTELVKKTLIEVASSTQGVMKSPSPLVRFVNFGNSSLDFELHFWSRRYIAIEDIKSNLRFKIDQAFREKNIEIPFPQRVVWMKQDSKKEEA